MSTAQRPPAELRYADELKRLAESDDQPKPPGWALSLPAVRSFLLFLLDQGLRTHGTEVRQHLGCQWLRLQSLLVFTGYRLHPVAMAQA
mgnify:CR=1 FL=1